MCAVVVAAVRIAITRATRCIFTVTTESVTAVGGTVPWAGLVGFVVSARVVTAYGVAIVPTCQRVLIVGAGTVAALRWTIVRAGRSVLALGADAISASVAISISICVAVSIPVAITVGVPIRSIRCTVKSIFMVAVVADTPRLITGDDTLSVARAVHSFAGIVGYARQLFVVVSVIADATCLVSEHSTITVV